MYTILVEEEQSGRRPVTRLRVAPYIAKDDCVRAARAARTYLPQMKASDSLPYPVAELVHALPLKLAREKDLSDSHVRWAVAHDVGHWLLKHPNRAVWYFELEADIFARELLMPKSDVERYWNGSIRDLARLFRVPVHKAEWAVSEYFSKTKTFDCPLLSGFECGSLQAISECRRLSKPRLECFLASQRTATERLRLYASPQPIAGYVAYGHNWS